MISRLSAPVAFKAASRCSFDMKSCRLMVSGRFVLPLSRPFIAICRYHPYL